MTKLFFPLKWMLIFSSLLLQACSAKLSTTLTDTESALSASKPAPSSVVLLEMKGSSAQATCSPQNKISLLVTQNSERAVKCRDITQNKGGLALGPLCAEGVVIASVASSSTWVNCDSVKICGVAAKTKRDLESDPQSRMTQLEFLELPWGCVGQLEWAFQDQTEDQTKIQKIAIDITPPPCPACAVSGSPTCAICGTDSIKPVINEVISEVVGCNQIRVKIFATDAQSGLHRDAYSFDGGQSWQSSDEFIFSAMNLQKPAANFQVRDRALNIGKWTTRDISQVSPPCPCRAPWGETIPHGEARTAFKVGAVQCNQSCDTQSVTRSCSNGVLSGDNSFNFNACKIQGCPKCKLPWNEEIEHGQSVPAYAASNVTCADQCRSSVLSCERGVLKGDAATYKSKACAFTKPTCNCEFNGTVIPNEGSRNVFAAAAPACGQTCTTGSVSCNLGTLSGNTNYIYSSCVPKECKCTTSWGQKLNLNEEVNAYKADSLSCLQNMRCDDTANKIRIKCVNVTTNEISLALGVGNIAEFTKSACSAPVCGCQHLGTIFKPSDGPMKVYKFETSVPPTTCEGVGSVGSVKCVQSGQSFVVQGDTNTAVFKYTRCQDPPGGGKSTETIGPGAGGGNGGGVGNDTGEGEGFRRRSVPGSGSGCDVNAPPYVCPFYDYGFVYSTLQACYLPGPNGPRTVPTDKTDITGRVMGGAYITAYSRKEVTCGDSCAKYSQLITCNHTGWSSIETYPYTDCREVCP